MVGLAAVQERVAGTEMMRVGAWQGKQSRHEYARPGLGRRCDSQAWISIGARYLKGTVALRAQCTAACEKARAKTLTCIFPKCCTHVVNVATMLSEFARVSGRLTEMHHSNLNPFALL